MKQTAVEAIGALVADSRVSKVSTASARRVVRACRTLGLKNDEVRAVMIMLEYCDEKGNPHYKKVQRVWP